MTHHLLRGRWAVLFGLLAALALPVTTGSLAFAEEEEGEAETEEAHLPWVMDFTKATAQAKAENKDLVINFTGSDWCGWCIRLDKEVFMHKEFVDAATKKFVFVFMDKPNSEELKKAVVDPELRDRLFKEYSCAGYPTIMVTTADGTPYGRTGYKAGGPEAYLKHLDELQEGGAAVKKLIADTEHKDLEALKAAFPVLADNNLLGYPAFDWVLDAADKADPDGSLGLKEKVAAERERRLRVEEEEKLKALFPKEQRPPTDAEFAKIHEALMASKHLSGRMFVGVGVAVAQWLAKGERIDDAKAMIERVKQDDLYKNNPQAQAYVDGVAAQLEKGGEDEEEDEDDDDEDDGEDDDGGDDDGMGGGK